MINPAILSQRVHDKLEKACLTAIVTETFMKALPFTTEEVYADAKKYTSYVGSVMESLHCENMLDRAVKAHSDNPNAMNLLTSIQEAVNSAVIPATKRIVTEATDSKCSNINEVVDKSAFTDAEKKTLMNKRGEIGIDTISNIIKKKVVNTIKDEKEAYDAALKLKSDIKDNLKETLGESAPSLESYMDIILQKSDPRDHISFFSRLQDTCMESLMRMESKEDLQDEDNISLECLVNTTINSTLRSFDKSTINLDDSLSILTKAIESLDETPEDMDARKDICAHKCLIMSIIITTIMETLKTMNLWTPSLDELKEFIDSPSACNNPSHNLEDKVHAELMHTKKMLANPSVNKDGLSAALGAFNQMKAKISGISEEILPNKEALMKEITEAATLIEGAIAEESTGSEDTGMDYYTTRAREANVAEFDRVARVRFRNPNTKKVQIICESEGPMVKNNSITIQGLSNLGSITDKITACITMTPAFKTLVDELKTCCKFSKMGDYANQTEIYFPDKCRAMPLADPDCKPLSENCCKK